MTANPEKNTAIRPDPMADRLDGDARETARALKLAVAQISMSLKESSSSIESLIGSITGMAGCIRHIEQPGNVAATDTKEQCTLAGEYMQQAVSAFQFYDRLTQRITHIKENLREIIKVVEAPGQQHASMWKSLQEKVLSVYSLEQEQRMYQALLHGISAENVITNSPEAAAQTKNNDIELF